MIVQKVTKLSSPVIEVDLDPARPIVVAYRSVATKEVLYGSPDRIGPEVIFYDAESDMYKSSLDEAARLECALSAAGGAGTYACRLLWKEKPAAEFELVFSVAGNRLTVTSRLLKETDPVRIASIKLPLITAFAAQSGAKLALPTRSGRLVDIEKSDPIEHLHKVDWFEIIPIAMAYHSKMLGLVSLTSYDDQMISQIRPDPKCGTIIVEFVRRPITQKPELQFLVQQDSSCSVTILNADKDKEIDWTAGAAVVRDTIPRNINSLYSGSFIYKILLDSPKEPQWIMFSEARDMIQRVNRLTGGARQVVYLIGWQHNGHDTGYPDTSVINPRVGTLDQLKTTIELGKLQNAIVSVHDNFHDAYMDSPAWDPAIIAVDQDGELAKGGVWAGGQAYVISPAAYEKQAAQRAKKTVDMLGIKDTIHLDVFTDDPDRIDFNPKVKAGRNKNIAAKLAMVNSFNKLGVDVTAEVLTAPFTSRISHYWQVESRPVPIWSAEESIPLVPMIYHGKITAGSSPTTDDRLLNLFLSGWTFSADFNRSTTDEQIMDLYYLVTLPWASLANREISAYEKNGTIERVTYNRNTYVEVDRSKLTYKIVRDGILVASNFATMIPIPDGRIAVYSRKDAKITVDLPESWTDSKKIQVTRLRGSEGGSYKVSDGKLTITASARTPYHISYKNK